MSNRFIYQGQPLPKSYNVFRFVAGKWSLRDKSDLKISDLIVPLDYSPTQASPIEGDLQGPSFQFYCNHRIHMLRNDEFEVRPDKVSEPFEPYIVEFLDVEQGVTSAFQYSPWISNCLSFEICPITTLYTQQQNDVTDVRITVTLGTWPNLTYVLFFGMIQNTFPLRFDFYTDTLPIYRAGAITYQCNMIYQAMYGEFGTDRTYWP